MIRRLAPSALVLVAVIGYPVAVLGDGAPRFPKRTDCIRPATKDGDIEAVFGRFDLRSEAAAELRRVLERGFTGSQIEGDGCGRLKVVVHGIPTLAVGRELTAEIRSVGLDATLEYASP
jgi:hypothetical protein